MKKQSLSVLLCLFTAVWTLSQVKINQFVKKPGQTSTGFASQDLLNLTFLDSCRSQFTINLSGCPNVTPGSTVDVELVAASTGGAYGAGQTIASATYTYGQPLSGAVTNDNNWSGNINSYLFGNLENDSSMVFDKFGWDKFGSSGADDIGVVFRVKINDPKCCVNNTWGELTINNNDICAHVLNDTTSVLALADCDGGGEANLSECQKGNNPIDSSDDIIPTIAKVITSKPTGGIFELSFDITKGGTCIPIGEELEVCFANVNGFNECFKGLSGSDISSWSISSNVSGGHVSLVGFISGIVDPCGVSKVLVEKKAWADPWQNNAISPVPTPANYVSNNPLNSGNGPGLSDNSVPMDVCVTVTNNTNNTCLASINTDNCSQLCKVWHKSRMNDANFIDEVTSGVYNALGAPVTVNRPQETGYNGEHNGGVIYLSDGFAVQAGNACGGNVIRINNDIDGLGKNDWFITEIVEAGIPLSVNYHQPTASAQTPYGTTIGLALHNNYIGGLNLSLSNNITQYDYLGYSNCTGRYLGFFLWNFCEDVSGVTVTHGRTNYSYEAEFSDVWMMNY